MKLRYFIVVIVILALFSVLAFYWGKSQGNTQITNIATNEILIKDIAELAALEVQGNAQITESNIDNSDGLMNTIKKAFVEKTININMPYVAKYGIQADSSNMKIRVEKNNNLLIQLPEAKLLSYEIRLDRATQSSTQGWLKTEDYASYNAVQQKLYKSSKQEAELNIKNKSLAQEKIIEILKSYYQPLGYKVNVQFGETKAIELFPSLVAPAISH